MDRHMARFLAEPRKVVPSAPRGILTNPVAANSDIYERVGNVLCV
jgi:hypothetical protein